MILHHASAPSRAFDQDFFDRCVSLFLGFQSGHLGGDMYQHHSGMKGNTPMSGTLTWEKHAAHSTFPEVSQRIVRSSIDGIARIIKHGTPLVEYGPGAMSDAALLIKSLGSRCYIPVDISSGIIEHVRELSVLIGDQCDVTPVNMDFFSPGNKLPIDFPVVGALLGSTISNMPGAVPDSEPSTQLIMALRNLTSPLVCGGHFLVATDANQDGVRNQELYNEEWHRRFGVNFLYRIAAEIPTQGFDPDGFEYHPVWYPHCSLLAHTIRATADQEFILDPEGDAIVVQVKKGDVFHYNNSFKYRPAFFEACAQAVGLEIVKKWEDHGSVQLYLFSVPAPGTHG
jgi:uncharacterized SAM-dependent methyltransferase